MDLGRFFGGPCKLLLTGSRYKCSRLYIINQLLGQTFFHYISIRNNDIQTFKILFGVKNFHVNKSGNQISVADPDNFASDPDSVFEILDPDPA